MTFPRAVHRARQADDRGSKPPVGECEGRLLGSAREICNDGRPRVFCEDISQGRQADPSGHDDRPFGTRERLPEGFDRLAVFDGEAILRTVLTAAIAGAPSDIGALDTLFQAFRSVVPLLEDNRPYSKPRHEVISSTPALRERELAKTAALADALAAALKARGIADLSAALAAQTGMAAFVHATISWLDNPEPGLAEQLDRAFDALKSLSAPRPSEGL